MSNDPWPWPKTTQAEQLNWSSWWPWTWLVKTDTANTTITNHDAVNTADVVSPKLLPCPFCGSSNIAHITVPQYETPGLPDHSWVQCSDCGAEIDSRKVNRDQYESAVDAWNNRVG